MANRVASLLLTLLLAATVSVASGQTGDATDLSPLYESGAAFADFLEGAARRRTAWHRNWERAVPDPTQLERARDLPAGSRLLVVAEDWCGDSVNTIPYLARFVEAVEGLEMRIVGSAEGADLMARFRTPDDRTATPTVVALDASGRAVGAWVERPSELQRWFLESQEELPRRELFDRKYAWYDEDAGRSTVREIVDLLTRVSAADAAGPDPAELQLQEAP